MKFLIAYRKIIIFSIIVATAFFFGIQYAIINNTFTPPKEVLKDIGTALLGFFGYLIGFLLTIVSILASNKNILLERLKLSGHYKQLIGMTLFVAFLMFLFCLYILIILILGSDKQLAYFNLSVALFSVPIILMLKLFYIYYLLLSR